MIETALDVADLGAVACPGCLHSLVFEGTRRGGRLVDGTLHCTGCGSAWPVRRGLAALVDEEAVQGSDRLMRVAYDAFGLLHDPAVRWLLPVLQGESAARARDRYLERLELPELVATGRRRTVRVLEVGMGGGANVPLLERRLPAGLDVEIFGVDLSRGMLRSCALRMTCRRGRRVRLAQADAHALPFQTAKFDRVFHVGAIASYRDPALALAEMARVARPDTPIVVVDEQLDPARRHSLFQQLAFRAITLLAEPTAPVRSLPRDAFDVRVEQVSRFYYCLRFRVDVPPSREAPA